MNALIKKALSWVFYRVSLRWPKALAVIRREVPLQSVAPLYSVVPRWEKKIPNIVYQTWVTSSLGRSHAAALKQFRNANADFSFQFFTDMEVDEYMAASYGNHPIYEVYVNSLFGPLKTDIWRYCILYERGGVYCDIGKALQRPLREFIGPSTSGAVSWEKRNFFPLEVSQAAASVLQHPNKRVINWIMMFSPGHPILKRAIDGIAARYPKIRDVQMENPKEAIIAFTGPVWLTQCVIEAAETGELVDVAQAGFEFGDSAIWSLPGSWVRYQERPAYSLERNRPIVSSKFSRR